MNGLKGRVVGKALVVTIAVSALSVATGIQSASAASQVTQYTPGNVTFYQTEGYGYSRLISIPDSYAWRSPATTGQQTVYVRFQIVRPVVGGSWTTDWITRTIPSGAQGVWLPRQTWSVSSLLGAPFTATLFRVTMEVHWHAASSGAYLGGRAIAYNQDGDYRCMDSQGNGPCFVGNGGLIIVN